MAFRPKVIKIKSITEVKILCNQLTRRKQRVILDIIFKDQKKKGNAQAKIENMKNGYLTQRSQKGMSRCLL
jgi:hypothetical protein